MDQKTSDALFTAAQTPEVPAPAAAELPPARPRLRVADRKQILLRPCSLEETLPAEHDARTVWALVCRWDLKLFLAAIEARGEKPGRPATDPRILLCLWLYAYIRGVSSGRELDRLCQSDDAYRWILGGVTVNYHLLNDFRVEHEKALDDLFTQMIAALVGHGLVDGREIACDGTRVRAGAGRGSFRTIENLNKDLQEAREHVEKMKTQASDPSASQQRQKAAERAARERVERIEQAVEEAKKVQEAKEKQKEKKSKHQPARASTTDPEARVMRMPDGGAAPGYNVQLAVDTASRAVVAVTVTNAGSDVHESQPIREQAEERTGKKVEKQLCDGGFIGLDAVKEAAAAGVTMYAPVKKPKKSVVDPHLPKRGDSKAVAEWRVRMGTEEAKEIYRRRASTVETVNGECKAYRGLDPMLVRGIAKVQCLTLLSVMAYSIVHFGMNLVM